MLEYIHSNDKVNYSNKFLQSKLGAFSFFVPKGTVSYHYRELSWSLADCSCSERRRVLLVLLFVNQNRIFSHWTPIKIVKNEGVKGVSMPGWMTASCSKSGYSHWNSISFRLDDWYLIVSMFRAPILENTSSHISIVPSWLAVIATRASCLFKKSCLWDNNKLQAARRSSWEHIIFSWTRSFTVSVTEVVHRRKTTQCWVWDNQIA